MIHVIAADGFINQDCVTNKFALPNATYMCDSWHLFDSILPKRFGVDTFNLIKSYDGIIADLEPLNKKVLSNAKNLKIVMLSGTPIVNAPVEIAYTFNLLCFFLDGF